MPDGMVCIEYSKLWGDEFLHVTIEWPIFAMKCDVAAAVSELIEKIRH